MIGHLKQSSKQTDVSLLSRVPMLGCAIGLEEFRGIRAPWGAHWGIAERNSSSFHCPAKSSLNEQKMVRLHDCHVSEVAVGL